RSFERGDGVQAGRGTGESERFNGAALFRARRYHPPRAAWSAKVMLQRSRALSSAEIPFVPHQSPLPASLQRSRALSSAEITFLSTTSPQRSWKLQRSRALSSAEIS